MPISPAMAESLSKAVLDVMVRAETTMLEKVARRIARGIDQPGWAESKLAEIAALRREIEAAAEQALAEATTEADQAIRHAYNRGVATAGTDLVAVGVSRDLAYGVVNVQAVEALVQEASDALRSTRLRILRSTTDVYREAVADAAADVLTGTVTRREAAQRTLDRFASRGVTGFVDRAGRSWDLSGYSEMAVRTATGRAAVNGHVDRLLEMGRDLVIVSDAPQECDVCRRWEGAVLSITGQTSGTVRAENLRGSGSVTVRVAGTVAQARAAGLHHPNCRHTLSLYQPGVTRPMVDTEDPQGDRDRQELRRMERQVRGWKRREAVALDPAAKAKADAKVREWQGKIREHTATSTAKRQRQREQIGRAR